MYKAVLVEDEAIIRHGLKQLIEEVIGGFQVVGEASNGKQALELLKGVSPDLLITDIRMNEMNGIEMIKRVRELYPELYILIISGYADFEYAKQAIKYGVGDYLLKPIDRIELTQVLDQFKRRFKPDEQTLDAEDDPSSSGRHLIRKVKELIIERLDREVSLQYIADQVHLNPQYLSVLFKSETGQNFSDYVTNCRMKKAKQLLIETNLKIYEIAALSGYVSAKHFMAVFKDVVGKTPSQYRDQPD